MKPAGIRLLVRADDAGSSWASNKGCVRACAEGIARSVEVMMPCAWVEHAADLLRGHPAIDVGIHLTLTSEWDAVKWRPLTQAESLIDEDGYFRPLLMPRAGDGRPSQLESGWVLEDVAAELAAQVERGLAKFPQASHVSSHMVRHFEDFDPAVGEVVAGLCEAHGLKNDLLGVEFSRFEGYPKSPRDAASRIESFVAALRGLEPGTYVFVDHPAQDTPEMQAVGHIGYEDVAADRASCLEVFTSPVVRRALKEIGVELISYRDV